MSSQPAGNGFGSGLVIRAPAKLNLSLAVLARRTDGFHEIESLMVPVTLHDTLRVRRRDDDAITLAVRYAGRLAGADGRGLARDVPVDDSNLVVRAARALREQAGATAGLDIELVKEIPSGAGLGGGSSDAAAVLLAAAGSDDAAVRSRAAYALGVVGGTGATARLAALLGDAADNVRYNSAVGLARQRDPAAWDVLEEMLTLPDVEAPAGDDVKQSERYKRAIVALNGLKAVGLLVDSTRTPPPASVAARVTALRKDPVPDVRTAATALAAKLERISGSPSSSPLEQ